MAFIVDAVLVTMIFFAIAYAALAVNGRLEGWAYYIVAGLYLGLLPATPLQATFGKRMVGLRICDRSGNRIGVLRALLRLAALVPSVGIAGAGFVLAAFTPRRQALHDLAAGTLVVRRDATPEAIAEVPPPVSALNRVSLVLGYALLAFGVYYVHTVLDRQRRYEEVNEAFLAAQQYKAEVEKALRSRSPVPAPTATPRGARSISARPDGTIVIEVSDDLFAGGQVMLRPTTNAKGEVMWTCRAEKLPGASLPVWCRG